MRGVLLWAGQEWAEAELHGEKNIGPQFHLLLPFAAKPAEVGGGGRDQTALSCFIWRAIQLLLGHEKRLIFVEKNTVFVMKVWYKSRINDARRVDTSLLTVSDGARGSRAVYPER